MSTAALPGSFPANESGFKHTISAACVANGARRVEPTRSDRAIRRRGSREQGQALETLGHALEYLVDSRLFSQQGMDSRSEREAIKLLMHSSRAVFRECPEVVPIRTRIGRWMSAYWLRFEGL